jgi:uncharacterized membrane protein
MILLHISAGLVSLLAGFVALYASKGAWLHRRSGQVFTGAMLAMAGSGAMMALFLRPNRLNLIVGVLTCYLVATGLLAVRRSVAQAHRLLVALMGIATVAGLSAVALGLMAAANPSGRIDHFPAGMIFMFAFLGLAAALGDARMLRRGSIEGVQRLTRHLWRMGLALLLATTSLFLGQTRHLPDMLRTTGLNKLPVLLVLATIVFWLVRLRLRSRRASRRAAPTRALDHA